MTTNLSILDQNIIAGLSEDGEAMYLRLRQRHPPLMAEIITWRWEPVAAFLRHMLPIASNLHGTEFDPSLFQFFFERFVFNFSGKP